jgi:hypothetical protein
VVLGVSESASPAHEAMLADYIRAAGELFPRTAVTGRIIYRTG